MKRVESLLSAPEKFDGPSLADWAEAAMIIEKRKYMPRAILRQRLRSATSATDEEVAPAIDYLLAEVSRRNEIAPDAYPFYETSFGLTHKGASNETLYEFLLWLAASPEYRLQDRYNEIEEPFDVLVKQALIKYLGSGAKGVRFGFPSSDGRPSSFPEAIRWLSKLLNLGVGAGTPRPRVKDGGVDVVVWRPFKDCRAGFVVILCQCTVEKDWPPKAKDIVPEVWNGWIDFGRNPITGLAIPFAIPATFEKWDELRRTVNILLDRLRLCELIGSAHLDNYEEIQKWALAERELLSSISEGQ